MNATGVDPARYKPRLRAYLTAKGVAHTDADRWQCIMPDHADNDPTAWVYDDERLYCPICGYTMDIFDVAGVLINSTKFPDQMREVQSVIDGVTSDPPADIRAGIGDETTTPAPLALSIEAARKLYSRPKIEAVAAKMKSSPGSLVEVIPAKTESGQVDATEARFESGPDKKSPITFWTSDGKHLRTKKPPVVLFGRDQLAAYPDATVVVPEGPKCQSRPGNRFAPAFAFVSWNGGAKKVLKPDWAPLHGRNVVLWPDADDPGREAMERLAAHLYGKAASVRVVQIPSGVPQCWDIADALADGWLIEQISGLIEGAIPWEPREDGLPTLGADESLQHDFVSPSEIIARTIHTLSVKEAEGNLPDRPCTDLGNAERVADRFHRIVKYVPELDSFAYDDGMRFVLDDQWVVFNLLKLVVRDILLEAYRTDDDGRRKELKRWALQSEERKRLVAAFDLLKSDPRVITPLARFDIDPWDINLRNGVYNALADTFRARERGELFLQVAGAEYRPEATAPKWIETLRLASNDRRDWVDRLQVFLGYGLTGDNSGQVFAEGSGNADKNTRNMKSTIVNVNRGVMGTYARTVSPGVFLYDRHRRDDAPRPELAQLASVRMVFSSETPANAKFDVQLMKQVFGDDPIRVRQLYGRPFEYVPVFKLFILTNHKLRIGQYDDAIARRIMYFPFDYQVPVERCIPKFADRLLDEERDGILMWILAGAGMWARSQRFPDSKTVDGATAAYLEREDIVRRFIDEVCVKDRAAKAYTGQLYEAFKSWAEKSGESVAGPRTFAERLEALGYTKGKRTKHGIPWEGIGVLEVSS